MKKYDIVLRGNLVAVVEASSEEDAYQKGKKCTGDKNIQVFESDEDFCY